MHWKIDEATSRAAIKYPITKSTVRLSAHLADAAAASHARPTSAAPKNDGRVSIYLPQSNLIEGEQFIAIPLTAVVPFLWPDTNDITANSRCPPLSVFVLMGCFSS